MQAALQYQGGSNLMLYRTLAFDGRAVVVFFDARFAAAFCALAYAWEDDSAVDLLPKIVREFRKPRRRKRRVMRGAAPT